MENNEYYTRLIGDGEYIKLTDNDNLLDFSKREIDDIDKISYIKSIYNKRIIIGPVDVISLVFIYKIPDEWFIVGINNCKKFIDGDQFKCDQFDGLVKCLEDIYGK